MALIRIEALSTVFGHRPRQALQRVRGGTGRAALLAQSGHTLALHGVNLAIEAGEVFVVMGLSGSGKSTLLRHVNRLVEPTEGRVVVGGDEVTAMGPGALRRLRLERVSMVFQRFALLPHRDVLDNVGLGLEWRGLPRAQRREQAARWLDRVGLADVARQMPSQLSGGMQQRVGLARAWCAGTGIVLMDEPFSALDPLIRSHLQGELLRMQRQTPRCIVFVTHDLDEALRLGDRIALLHEGRVIQVGTPSELLLQPADEHVAAFTAEVNRARAWCAADALVPWPAQSPLPPLHEAVDERASIEQLLPRLVGAEAAIAVRRDDRIVGQVGIERVRAMLTRGRR